MAEGAQRVLGADVGIAVTGVAGPDEQDGQPVGTVWFGIALPGHADRGGHRPACRATGSGSASSPRSRCSTSCGCGSTPVRERTVSKLTAGLPRDRPAPRGPRLDRRAPAARAVDHVRLDPPRPMARHAAVLRPGGGRGDPGRGHRGRRGGVEPDPARHPGRRRVPEPEARRRLLARGGRSGRAHRPARGGRRRDARLHRQARPDLAPPSPHAGPPEEDGRSHCRRRCARERAGRHPLDTPRAPPPRQRHAVERRGVHRIRVVPARG